MYKYNCRKCPIRNRCIDESESSPNVKQMLHSAFEARTDTLKTWGRLQKHCLLLIAEQEREKRSGGESMLSRRLREVRERTGQTDKLKQKPQYLRSVSGQERTSTGKPKLKPLTTSARSKPKTQPSAADTNPLTTKAEPEWLASPSSTQTQTDIESSSQEAVSETALASAKPMPPRKTQKSAPPRPHWLTVGSSDRHIVLPTDGELVLGRFDPNIGVPPDIDLGFEDKRITVSRRHAKIVGTEGRHMIEDMGSRHGVLVNNKKITGSRHLLESGDRITLGDAELVYDSVPTHMLMISPDDRVHHKITVTPTGRRLSIYPPNDVTIGRADAYVDFIPDIDLSQDGEIANRVSRRHAVITWRNQVPYLEDMGSGFGTRLNGETLLMGQAVQLKPGDHIWLGGCVLAYDIDL
jgi:pSer/pThr/pTyr-binding forkhead associated (FHA) protein